MHLVCTVHRTHRAGEPIRTSDYGPGSVGVVSMCSTMHTGLRRMVGQMTLVAAGSGGEARPKYLLAPLYEPKLLTFGSDRGMMVVGFEEIDGRRFYQGWWMQWD